MVTTCHQQRNINKCTEIQKYFSFLPSGAYVWFTRLPNNFVRMNKGNSRRQNSGQQFWGGFSFDVIGRCGPIYVKSTLFQCLGTGDILVIGWPSQPVSHPSFRSFPVDARTGIAVGRRLRTAQDLRAPVRGWRMVARWRASLLFVGNTIPPAKQDILAE